MTAEDTMNKIVILKLFKINYNVVFAYDLLIKAPKTVTWEKTLQMPIFSHLMLYVTDLKGRINHLFV